ncbi:MAG: cytochrome C biosynthesis protein [Pseudomonadota bacterium]|nr:cytochrome C biosynthesis protein [Pseudomonadota bacterium]
MRKILFALALLLTVAALVPVAHAAQHDTLWYSTDADDNVKIKLYFFWSEGCPHCRKAQSYIKAMGKEDWIDLKSYDTYDPEGGGMYSMLARMLKKNAGSVPAFIYCEHLEQGWGSTETTGTHLRDQLEMCYINIVKQLTESKPDQTDEQATKTSETVDLLPAIDPDIDVGLPENNIAHIELFGHIVDPASIGLPVLTVALAGVDAFNPCAFFVLLFLLSLMVHAKSRARMMTVGGIFVFFSGLIYFLAMLGWLGIWKGLGLAGIDKAWLTTGAGLVALFVAAFNIKDFVWFNAGPSLSIPESAKPGLFARMRVLLGAQKFFTIVVGAAVLAVIANMYELLCTAGFPMVYTKILDLPEKGLSLVQQILYLIVYNVVYVIPLIVIVTVFVFTMGARKLTENEGQVLKLLSGLMMLVLGIVLVIDPTLVENPISAVGLVMGAIIATFALVAIKKRLRRVH